MDVLVMVVAGLFGGAFGIALPYVQHHLYSEAEFRAQPVAGRKRLLLQGFDATAGAASLALAVRPDHYDAGPALLTAAFLMVLVTLSSTDFDRRRIPDKVTFPAVVVAVALFWVWPDRSLTGILIGGAAGLGVAVGLGFLRFGGGDLTLVVLMGLLLGWRGLFPALLYGFLLGGVVAAVLVLRKGRRGTFAYGPYLAAGAAVVLLFPSLA